MAENSRNVEEKHTTMIINGPQLSDCIIISSSDGLPCVTKLECFDMNFGILKDVTKMTFNIGSSDIERFLQKNRMIIDNLCKNLVTFEVSPLMQDEADVRYYCNDGILYRCAYNQECLIKYPIGRKDDVVIVPSSSASDNMSFVIGPSAFEGAVHIKKIVLPGIVRKVYDFAFKNCISLETIDSEPLLSIGRDAFENCYSLKHLSVAQRFSMIGINKNNLEWDENGNLYDVYTKCRIELTEEMKAALQGYGYKFCHSFLVISDLKGKLYHLSFFGYCGNEIQCVRYSSENEELIVIEGNGELIGDELSGVFKCGEDHAVIFIGDHITGIKKGYEIEDVYDSVFSGQYAKIVVGNNVKKIDDYVFSGVNIRELVLGESLKIIGEGAFFNTSIEELFIPDSVNTIGSGIFEGEPCRCKIVSLSSTISKLDESALTCRGGGPKIFLRGERPPKNLCMWLLAGLDYYIMERRLYIPGSWKQYLNNDYFETTRRVIQEDFHKLGWDKLAEREEWLQAIDCFQYQSRISEIMEIDDLLAKFSNSVPVRGMNMGYLDKAGELLDVYGEMLSIMDEDRTQENEQRVVELARKIKSIVDS